MAKNIYNLWEIENINYDDRNKNKTFQYFYDSLNNEYEKFKDNSKNSSSNEKKKIESPLTIFDGNWGSGKTYFIEGFINWINNIKNDKNVKKFTKSIYIDALELIDDENIVYEFMNELFNSTEKLKSTKRNYRKKIFNTGLNSVIGILNGSPLPVDIAKKNIVKETVEEKVQKANDNQKDNKIIFDQKTFFFVDNIERIGYDSKRIIQLIYKLRKVKGLFFILITNVKMLEKNIEFDDKNEYPIYKFTNTKTYKFNQDYKSILLNLKPNDIEIENDELNIINNSLNNASASEQYTIRTFERWIIETDFYLERKAFKRIERINSIPEVDVKKFWMEENLEKLKKYTAKLNDINGYFTELRKNYLVSGNALENQYIDIEGYVRFKESGKNASYDSFLGPNNKEINADFEQNYGNLSNKIWTMKTENNMFIKSRMSIDEVKKISTKTDYLYNNNYLKKAYPSIYELMTNLFDKYSSFNFELINLEKYPNEVMNDLALVKKYYEKISYQEMKNEANKIWAKRKIAFFNRKIYFLKIKKAKQDEQNKEDILLKKYIDNLNTQKNSPFKYKEDSDAIEKYKKKHLLFQNIDNELKIWNKYINENKSLIKDQENLIKLNLHNNYDSIKLLSEKIVRGINDLKNILGSEIFPIYEEISYMKNVSLDVMEKDELEFIKSLTYEIFKK